MPAGRIPDLNPSLALAMIIEERVMKEVNNMVIGSIISIAIEHAAKIGGTAIAFAHNFLF